MYSVHVNVNVNAKLSVKSHIGGVYKCHKGRSLKYGIE